MRHLPLLKAQLRRHEGIRYKPYKDTVGKLTIGVGRNLDDKGISEQEAEYLLGNDIEDACVEATTIPGFSSLTPIRQCVLVELCFNMGVYRVKKFKKMIAALVLGDWNEASMELLDSKWAEQVGYNRSTTLANQLRTGKWQK